MGISVRLSATPDRMTEDVARTIVALDTKTLPDDARVDPRGCYWWLALEDSEPVGFGGLRLLNGSTGFLCRAGVIPARRGHGLHKRLIVARIRYARRLGLSSLVTYTGDYNVPSTNALIRCGFRHYKPRVLLNDLHGVAYLRIDL